MTNADNKQEDLLQRVERLWDSEVKTYLENKHRGGRINEKGADYESYYATFQLAKRAPEVIEEKKVLFFSSQIIGFVDDLVIENDDDDSCLHYQLKTSAALSWGSKLKSLCDDFAKQYQYNCSMGKENSVMCLVVSNLAVRDSMSPSIPSKIAEFTRVLHFPFDEEFRQLLAHQEEFKKAIKYLCAFEEPEPDKIECVATVLLGAWQSANKSRISALELLKTAQSYSPSYIRSFEVDREFVLDPAVKIIFDNISGFSYNLNKGFFHWSFLNGLDRGTLPYSCEKEDFRRFQERVKQQEPTNFDDLENLL